MLWRSLDDAQKDRQLDMEAVHKAAFIKVCSIINEKLITHRGIIKLSDLRSIYVKGLEDTAFSNPNYRSENLKVKLKNTYGEKITFAPIGSSGKFQTCLVYSSAIDVGALVKL